MSDLNYITSHFGVKLHPKESDEMLILENYWENFKKLFSHVTEEEFISWINEDYFGGWEETEDYNSTGRRELKMLYVTIRAAKPKKILEIGTHMGTGTNHILLALSKNKKEGFNCSVTTIDIEDFVGENKLYDFPLRKLLINSLDHLKNENDYDCIIQDGCHDSENVKNELDVFKTMKNLKTLWSHDYYLNNNQIGNIFENYGKQMFDKSFPFIESSYIAGFFIGVNN